MYKDYLTAKGVVEKVLKKYPETRSSDKLLFLKILNGFGMRLTEGQEKIFLKMPVNFESIRRSRQYLQNTEMKYRPEIPVLKAREKQRKIMHDEFVSDDDKARLFSKQCL